VAPAAYAIKGSPLARDLWLYKSHRPGARLARANLLALLLVFLHDHAPGAWAGAGLAAPTHACVVPSGRGRPGPHPLESLARPYLRLPWAGLVTQVNGGAWDRMLDPARFRAAGPLPGAAVLLLDDTWVSGGSAQSAAVALKQAGARTVALVVVGRHIAAPAAPPAGP
jgi:hypothetical protein